MKKRTLAALLSLALCCTSAAALAKTQTAHGLTIESSDGDWTFADYGMLTITEPGSYTLSGSGKYVTVSDVKGAVTITLDSVSLINDASLSPMSILNSGKTTLVLKGSSSLAGGSRYVAALDHGTNPLEITCRGCGTAGHTCGEITVDGKSNYWSAAIGSGYEKSSNNLTISGGVVNAKSSFYGAAIGGGYHGQCLGVTITGGTVNAENTKQGAAIGSGLATSCKNIVITGGVINASALSGAAIGSGPSGSMNGITISGGTITAKADTGAAIGSGHNAYCQNILISGGDISAEAELGAAIGSGGGGNMDGITISGGDVTAKADGGAAIGGGYGGVTATNSKNTIISGGSVTAEATGFGAAIGGGGDGEADGITISGGSVTAKAENGAAIGGGSEADGKNITISGGSIEAGTKKNTQYRKYGDAVGAGRNGSSSNIVITPEKHRIEASVSKTGFAAMDTLEGSPFTEGSTDVTSQVSGFQFFKTIGERIGAIDMPSTGDSASLALWTALLALSGALLMLMKRRTAG